MRSERRGGGGRLLLLPLCMVVCASTFASYGATNHQNVASATLGESESWVDANGANAETSNRAGVDYVLDKTLVDGVTSIKLTMPTDGSDVTFNGDSLTLKDGAYLQWNKQSSTSYGPLFSCKYLKCEYNSYIEGGNKCPMRLGGGKVEIAGSRVYFCSHGKRHARIESELVGNGKLLIIGKNGTSAEPHSYHHLAALNTNFYGMIVMRQRDTSNNNFTKALTLTISDARSLGGNLDSMDYGLHLTRYAKLIVTATTALSAKSNRGVLISEPSDGTGTPIGRISVANGCSFRIETAVALNGTLYKEDEGVLELAGAAKFGSSGKGDSPTDGMNGLVVSGGVVRVCSAEAINGMAVEIAPGGALELSVNLADADMTRYGIRNCKTTTPFSLPEGVTELPLTLKADGVVPVKDTFSIGVLTVHEDAETDVEGMLPEFTNPFRGYAMAPTRSHDAEARTVTFGLSFVKVGMRVVIR